MAMKMLKKASSKVTGERWASTSVTGLRCSNELPRSPWTTPPSQVRYWRQAGLSSPSSAVNWATCSSETVASATGA